MKELKNKDLKSRREFFKEAAKKTLPVIGIIAFAKTSAFAQVISVEPMGCNTGCSGGCRTLCEEGCSHTCNGGCRDTCKDHCNKTCQGSSTTYWK